MDNEELKYWNALALCWPYETKKQQQLVKFFSSPQTAFQAGTGDLIKKGLDPELIQEFCAFREKIDLEKEWQKLVAEEIKLITLKDENYPYLLKEIYDPPTVLYYQGKLLKEENYPLAVVGTRKMSAYGRQVVLEMVRELVRHGLTIVSGLALGIDGLAHEITLKEKGRTIAVLGSGLNQKNLYPSHHCQLAQKIVASHGALVSEYPFGTPATRFTFPQRNRIIAGLSLGTLVIEAPLESGALITARLALEQNREVLAVPGSIYSRNSQGTNIFIKLGAKPVTGAKDVLEALNLELLLEKKKEIKPETKEEEILLRYLSREPIYIDELIKKTGLASGQISATLSIMEIREKVKNLGGGNYILND